MESFEQKLSRLTPELKEEVERYVDYLLSRSAIKAEPQDPPDFRHAVPPPMIAPEIAPEDVQEPAHSEPGAGLQEIGFGDSDYLDYGKFEEKPEMSPAVKAVERVKEKLVERKKPEPEKHILDWID